METAPERNLSVQLMHGAGQPAIERLRPGATLLRQGEHGTAVYLVLDGVVQAAGAVLLVTGLALQKKEFVSDTYYGAANRGPRFSLFSVTPDVVPGSRYGLTLRGAIF